MPPATESVELTAQTNRLVFIWIWLPVAILGAVLATPADIVAIILAMAFALPCYLLGVICASNVDGVSRGLMMIVCVLIAGFLAVATWSVLVPYCVIAAGTFAGVNAFLGVKSCTGIVHNRRRVFAAIGIAYTIGLLLGPLGVLVLTVPAALMANRKPASSVGKKEQLDRPPVSVDPTLQKNMTAMEQFELIRGLPRDDSSFRTEWQSNGPAGR